jgi:ABC-type multidrug transport system ATPase subunit
VPARPPDPLPARRIYARWQVAINGLDPRSNRTQVLGTIGFVPQLPPPLKMPVGQLIDFSASLCGTDPQRIHDIAKRLGLDVDAFWPASSSVFPAA